MTASNTAFTIFSGLGLLLSLIPLCWHLRSWNVGTCMFMIWTALGCLVYFVDSIVWSGNTINWAPVWCDISIRVQIGLAVALPACALCIIRGLYYITCRVQPVQTQKRRGVIIDLLITIGLPVLSMTLEYVVAGHRFNIIEDFGCAEATWNTPLAYVLVWSWPLIIAIISACYGVLTIRAFLGRRKDFKGIISANANLSYDHYWRLIALASSDFFFSIPLTVRAIVTNAISVSGVHPWVSWADTHSGYSRVIQVPRAELDRISLYSYEVTRWGVILCAYLFFGFFGFNNEAKRNYRLLASTIAKFLGFTIFAEGTSTTSGSRVIDHSLHFAPSVSFTQQTVSASDSDSLSDKSSDAVNKFDIDLEIQPHSHVKQFTVTSSTNSSAGEVPQAPELVLSPASMGRPLVSAAPTLIYSGNVLGGE